MGVDHYQVHDPATRDPAFIAWCKDEDIDLSATWLISVCRRVIRGRPANLALVGEYMRNVDGRFYIEAGDVARTSRVVSINQLPPLLPALEPVVA
jgi:hypothetical protein